MNDGKYDNTQILKKSTIANMLTLHVEGNDSQGLCWYKINFESLWSQGGRDPGIRTEMAFNPENRIGIIVFKNNEQGRISEIVKKLYLSTLNSEI